MKNVMVIPLIVFFVFALTINSSAQDKKMEMKKKVESKETKVMDSKMEVEKKIEKSEKEIVATNRLIPFVLYPAKKLILK